MQNNHDGTFFSYYGKNNEWKVYRASDETLVCYRSRRDKDGNASGIDRVVTAATEIVQLAAYLDNHRPKPPRYDPRKDPNQQRIE